MNKYNDLIRTYDDLIRQGKTIKDYCPDCRHDLDIHEDAGGCTRCGCLTGPA